MYVRGGCDLSALMHYFTLNCKTITTEFNYLKDWQPLRLDHSSFLLNALNGLTESRSPPPKCWATSRKTS